MKPLVGGCVVAVPGKFISGIVWLPASRALSTHRGHQFLKVQITIEIQFEQRRRVVRRPAGIGTPGLGETQRVQVQRADEGIQETHGIIGRDVILQRLGEQNSLGAIDSATVVHACTRPITGIKSFT